MQLDGPGFIPKAVLTAGRVAHQPFEIPTEMTKSALTQSGVTHAAVGAINKAAADAVEQLEPRGPAKLLGRLFGKVDGALVHSAGQAQKATEVFWVPFSNGAHQVGHAVANPFSLFYAKRAGFEIPAEPDAAQALLASITDPNPESTKFPWFNSWPAPAAGGDGSGDTAPPTGGDGGDTPPPTGGDGGDTPPPTGGDGGGGDPTGGDGGGDPTGGDGGGGDTPPPTEGDGGGTPPPTDGGGDAEAAATGGVADPAATPEASAVPEGARAIVPEGAVSDAAAGVEAAVNPPA